MNLNKLRGLRAENNMTQAELAKKLKLSERSYSLKENGKRAFKDSEISRLCEIFKVDASIFF